MAFHQDVPLRTQNIARHSHGKFNSRPNLNVGVTAEQNSTRRNINCLCLVFFVSRLESHRQVQREPNSISKIRM